MKRISPKYLHKLKFDLLSNIQKYRMRTNLTLVQPTGTWTNRFAYDATKALTEVASPGGTFTYLLGAVNVAGPLPKKITLGNTSYITNTYDTMARLTGTYLKTSGNVLTNKHEYTYNTANQRTLQTFMDAATYGYTYDRIGQLTNADSSVSAQDRKYVYDAAWNLNYRTNNTAGVAFKVDGKNQLTNATPVGTLTYDDNGNLTASAGAPYWYAYDDENQLANIYYYQSGNGNGSPTSIDDYRTEFVYDGKGRLRKRVEYYATGAGPYTWVVMGETRYLYDGMRVIQERNSSNTPTVSYTRGTDLSGSLEGAGGIGGLLGRSHTYSAGAWSTHNVYFADGNGNITYMLDNNQTKVAEYRYDPFGNTISSSGSLATANGYRFSSKESYSFVGLTTLYYYGYRFYDPNLQRWLNRDPLGNGPVKFVSRGLKSRPIPGEFLVGPNLYEFAVNDPINHADTDGRIIIPALIIAAAVLAGWGLWEFTDAIKNAQKNAEIGAHNRKSQNDAISDTRTSYCPTRDKAVGNAIKDLAPDLYKMATGPGTLAGGPPGLSENAGDATISIIWTVVQPEPETQK